MSFRDRLTWDAATGAYADGAIRYMMIRPDAFMGILLNLPAEMRPQVLAAMAASIRQAGGKSAQSYRAAGAIDRDAMLATIQETAPQLGWGVWNLTGSDSGLDLTVANSPFPAGYGASDMPVCDPIKGMLKAVGEMVMGGPVNVTETSCAACGADICSFTVRPGTST